MGILVVFLGIKWFYSWRLTNNYLSSLSIETENLIERF